MAQKEVVKRFKAELKKAEKKIPKLIGVSTSGDVLDVTFDTAVVTKQFAIGIDALLEPLRRDGTLAFGVQPFEEIPYITKIVKKTIKQIRTSKQVVGDRTVYRVPLFTAKGYAGSPGTSRGSFIMRGGGTNRLTFRFVSIGSGRGTGANDTLIRGIVKAMRDNIYDQWLKGSGGPVSLFGSLPTRGSRSDDLTEATEIGHETDTTRGAIALQVLKRSRPDLSLGYGFTVFDVVDQIQKNLGLDVDRNYKRNKIGAFSFRYKINTSIMENFTGSEDSDFSKLKEKFIKQAVNDLFIKNKSFMFNLLNSSGSKSPKKLVVEDTIIELLGPLTKKGKPDMRFKANKKFKSLSDSFVVKRGKKSKPKRGVKVVKVPGVTVKATSARPEKNKREAAQNLSVLKAVINRKLPAQIRRNMGQPGVLTNRSGTFSNSPQVVNIRQSKTGLTGDYTYMKTGGGTPPRSGQPGVYQTFENSGRWKGKYNPKDLISKSIREVAIQHTTQRFVQLRRQ